MPGVIAKSVVILGLMLLFRQSEANAEELSGLTRSFLSFSVTAIGGRYAGQTAQGGEEEIVTQEKLSEPLAEGERR